MEKRIYNAHSNIQRPWVMVRDMIRDIGKGQDLAKRITIRDIKAMYRQSALGVLWAFILPIANAVTWIFLNSSGIVSMSDTGLPYPIYAISGTMIWAIFLESMQAPINKTTQNKSTLAKVNFPREAIVMAGVYHSFFNAGIKTILIIAILAFMGYLGTTTLLLVPLAIISLVMAGTAIGLLLTPLGMLYTDVSKGLPLLMQFLMYTAPVVYAIPKEGFTAEIIRANPITPLITTTREWLTGIETSFLNEWVYINMGVIAFLAIVLVGYRLAMPILIERMNA